jgi:hypothetical protein
LPGPVAFAEQLAPEARTTEQQAALGLFMLSHFLADATVPCHCDGRALTSTKVCGFHTQFEDHWGDIVGKRFHKKSLLQQSINRAQAADDLMALARGVDSRLGDPFTALAIPRVAARDLWDETVNICWGSFVVNGIVVPPSKIPYDSRLTTTRRKALSGRAGVGQDLDRAVLHDAVLNVAIAWKNLWRQASKVGKKKTGGS